ncbi:hypothetical protein [uncultured Tenacibaculum sp.]|uniref:hypothetical protein n=1 Tax=uncultured Tenacibaculum sp. TaxID=174713 RepID=UPI00261EA059|nr:hypothetical protein [uncultured Tenacibaculum sp.]
MHKKLASDLTSLAHSILQMKNKDDVLALKEKAHEVYEKLALLAYVEEYINTTPQAKETKEELLEKIVIIEETKTVEAIDEVVVDLPEEPVVKEEKVTEQEVIVVEEEPITEPVVEEVFVEQAIEESIEKNIKEDIVEILEEVEEIIEEEPIFIKVEEEVQEIEEPTIPEPIKNKVEEIEEQPFDELENLLFGNDDPAFKEVEFIEELKAPVEEEGKEEEVAATNAPTLEDELKDTLPVDVMADLFQKVEPKKTINDHLQTTIQIGLNDRIAFVKHLFDGDQTDFNRVLSQLNTFKTEKEAKDFINKMVKPDYDWSTKEEYETRFFEIIERRFI